MSGIHTIWSLMGRIQVSESILLLLSKVEQSVEANEESGSCSGRHADPNAVVLDYKLCGASVGLWTFSMVPQPLELFRFQ